MKLVYALLMLSILPFQVGAEDKPDYKEAMEDRVDILIDNVREIRKLFKNNEAKLACEKVPATLVVYKEHLKDAGTRLELNRSRSHKVIHWAYEQLIYFHKLNEVCKMGEDQEFVRMDETIDHLKNIIKSLKKQGRKIHRSEAESNNSFRYNFSTQIYRLPER